jgi:hypothetical protein
LERALSQAWVEATAHPDLDQISFYDVWQGTAGAVPALMLNTTNVATGHRMIVSHLSFPSRADLPTLACINSHLDIPLSTAAILSARFPWITPAGTVQVRSACDGSAIPPNARYADGGYFENSGLATILDAVEAIRQEAGRQEAVQQKEARHVRLVIISIETSAAITNYPTTGTDDPSYSGFAFGEALSPLRALLNTRQARGELAKLESERVVERLDKVCAMASQKGVHAYCVEAEVITFVVRPGSVPVPLGWSLSASARLELERQLGAPPVCSGADDNSNRCALFRVLNYVARGGSK